MANLTLKQLREAQAAIPSTVDADGIRVSDEPISPPSSVPSTEGPTPTKAPPSGGGYTRIFPPIFPGIGAIPQVWKDENWTGPSPWCHVEGAQQHPDFESNLLAVEAEVDEKCD